jgi:low temperature requirement protein LtrA
MTTDSLLRHGGGHVRVTYVELFFDLVFVFAVTQLSHSLVEHLDLAGALQTLLLLLAVWWVWIYTCWFTNWIDPDKPAPRVMLFLLMFAGLLLSASIPNAFRHEALLFASAYVFMQVSRSTFAMFATRGHNPALHRTFRLIVCWQAFAGAFWIWGGCVGGVTQAVTWIVALLIDCLGPIVYFYVPGLGASSTADWKVDGAHMAERCALFVIIALGESILVTGATAASLPATTAGICAFSVAFLGSVTMWWIYFNIGAERGSRQFAASADSGRVGRAVYTYFHIPIVAGIVVCAVADEITITHPGGHMSLADALVLLGGPALYLAGNVFFKRASAKYYPLSHLVGLGMLVLLAPFALALAPLALGAATTAVLVTVAIWETRSFSTRSQSEVSH